MGIEIDSTTIFKTSEQSQSPPSRLRNVTEILKSDFLNCTPTNDKLVFAVPPPLFRGEARVIVLRNNFCTITKPRPFRYPSKILNVIKGRNSQRRPAALELFSQTVNKLLRLFPTKTRVGYRLTVYSVLSTLISVLNIALNHKSLDKSLKVLAVTAAVEYFV